VTTALEQMTTVADILNFPANPPTNNINPVIAQALPTTLPSAPVTRLGDIASMKPGSTMNSINHYTIQRVIDVAANVEGRDLGSVAAEINKVIAEVQKDLPAATKITLRGQNEVMETSFRLLGFGLLLAIILVYMVLVILFQSWIDPFIIMMAVPAALLGIIWTLTLTGTTINVMSLMGAIMAVGISVSNSILVVAFANDLRSRNESLSPFDAVIESGKTRLRPVLMTALAMIMGMVPMALGLGDAGEQNAPLGRAVIGGLVFATLATLLLVPIFYTLLRKNLPALHTLDQRFAAEAAGASKEATGHG
jgi:multidrug efflux pump subunit AcrB